jgi:parallel beta-helix repeat protein
MEGSGAAFKIIGSHSGTSNPESIVDDVWRNERMPTISEIEITGSNPEADGIEISYALKPIISKVLIRDVRYGIHLTTRNRNVIIESSHIYNCAKVGVYLDAVNIHQININNCHISYNKESGIKVEASEIRNLQITGNDIEYNCEKYSDTSADIWIDTSKEGSSLREASITSNTIQAVPTPGGRNILLIGNGETTNKIGLLSITGNHISNQTVNIDLKNIRGVNIVGNTFIRGYDRHIFAENCQNLVISSNIFDRNDDYFPPELVAKGGIIMGKVQNVILCDNVIQGVEHLGAIELYNGSDISISSCHIIDQLYQGIRVKDCTGLNINGCTIKTNKKENKRIVQVGIYLTGNCKNVSVSNNLLDTGQKKTIVNETQNKIFLQSNMRI